jgi:hypothetical protein
MITIVFGFLLPTKCDIRTKTLLVEETRDLMSNRGLSCPCLAEENEATIGLGIPDPFNDVVQKILASAWMTTLSIVESPAF